MKKIKVKIITGLMLFMLLLSTEASLVPTSAAVRKDRIEALKPAGKKREMIHTRKQLINNIANHIINLDKTFSLRISKKALKNFNKDFDKLWVEISGHPGYNEISRYADIRYTYRTQGSYLFLDFQVKYSISKDKAKKLIKNSGKIVKTKKELEKAYISHILNLDKRFTLKIDKKALPFRQNAIDSFLADLSDNTAYNDLLLHADITDKFNNYKNYWEWIITPNWTISKEKGKKIIKEATPVIKTREELLEKMAFHASRLDEEVSLNISSEVVDFDSSSEYDDLWNDLYNTPEFSDINDYISNFDSYTYKYKNYYKWKLSYKYSISKSEVAYLHNFVKNWVATNILPFMTEEEKVRAINDFMVREYRYTFGDRGELPKDSPESGTEKIGKYSVYSCFALVYEKGGVCDSKAKLFYRLAKEAGIDVLYITGNAGGVLHAWNMVKIDGKWYHIDNTWNRGQYEGASEYEYFNTRDYYLKSDFSMSKDHDWDRNKFPASYEDYPLYNIPTVYINRSCAFQNAA